MCILDWFRPRAFQYFATINQEDIRVMCAIFERNDLRGFVIMVESQNDPFYVDEKVEKFLSNVPVGVDRVQISITTSFTVLSFFCGWLWYST